MINMLKNLNTKPRVYIITVPPTFISDLDEVINEILPKIIQEIAIQTSVEVIDLHSVMKRNI